MIDSNNIKKILIIKWSAMGDVIIAAAAMEDISKAFPSAEIHLNTLPQWQSLFSEDKRFQKIIALKHKGKSRLSYAETKNWIKTIKRENYDLIVDLQSRDRSKMLLTFLRLFSNKSKHYVGLNKARFPYTLAPPPMPKNDHVVFRINATLAAMGIQATTERPVLSIPKANRQAATVLLDRYGLSQDNYIVFLPGCQAEGYLKRWGVERYSALAKKLHADGVEKIILIGGPEELDECEKIEQQCGNWLVNLAGKTALLDIVPLAEKAKAIVGNDTGTGHLISVLNKPIIIICGPTDPNRVRPLGSNVITMQVDLPCINCYLKHCNQVDKHACMKLITPEMVYERLQQVI